MGRHPVNLSYIGEMSFHYSTNRSAPSRVPSSALSPTISSEAFEALLEHQISRLGLAQQIEPRKQLRTLKRARIVRDAASQFASDRSCSAPNSSQSDSGYESESTGSSTMTRRGERPTRQRYTVAERIDDLRVCFPDFFKENWDDIWKIEAAMGHANDEPINHIRYQCLLELCARLEAKQNPNRIDTSLIEGGRGHKAIREAERFPDAFLERSLSAIDEDARTPEGVNSEKVESNVPGDIHTSSCRDSADLVSPKPSLSITVSEIPLSQDTEPALIAASAANTATLSDDGSQSEKLPPPSDVPRPTSNPDESIKATRKLEIERLNLGSTRKTDLIIVNEINIAQSDSRLSDDPPASPISELGIIVGTEVRNGADPATDRTRGGDSTQSGSTLSTSSRPVSPSSSLRAFDFGRDPAPTLESPHNRSPLSGFDFGFDPPPTSKASHSNVSTQPSSTAKVKEAPHDPEARKGNAAEKHRKGIRSRLRARLRKPDRWNVEPGPRQAWSREDLQYWLARRAARRKERRARPRDIGESDFSSTGFTGSSASSVTGSEGSKKELSVESFDQSESENEGPRDSRSEASARALDKVERPGVVRSNGNMQNAETRKPKRRIRLAKISRSRARTNRGGLFAKFRRREKAVPDMD